MDMGSDALQDLVRPPDFFPYLIYGSPHDLSIQEKISGYYLRQAGAKATGRSANSEAVAYFEQALEALTHLPESCSTLEQAIDLRLDIRFPLNQLGENERNLEHLREAERLAEALDDHLRLGRV